MGRAIRVGGLVVVLAILLVYTLSTSEQLRQARCAEHGGSVEQVDGRWHCLAR